jgi:hypothetical protein
MSPVHPDAVGSYGMELCQFALKRTGSPLDWWQRLVSARVLEHDRDGELCWPEWLLTLARQGGKSWWLSEYATWRLTLEEKLGEPQNVLLVSNRLRTADWVQRRIRAWAERQDGWDARHGNGLQRVIHGANDWALATPPGAYGMSTGLAFVDEAWDVPPEHIEDGLIPTMLERRWGQLGIVSTAHHLAGALFVDRRQAALNDLQRYLLIEWSAEPWRELADEEGWRQANPRWSKKRRTFVDRELYRALNDRNSIDPLAHFRSQYLNTWPTRVALKTPVPGLPLLPEGLWPELVGDAELVGPVVFALDDIGGRAVATSAAGRDEHGNIVVEAYETADRHTAFNWVQAHSAVRPNCQLVVGPTLQHEPALDELGIPYTVSGFTESKGTLSTLRQVVSRRQLRHTGSPLLAEQVEVCRVVEPSAGGGGLKVVSSTDWSLVRAASWAVAGIDRQSITVPRIH